MYQGFNRVMGIKILLLLRIIVPKMLKSKNELYSQKNISKGKILKFKKWNQK